MRVVDLVWLPILLNGDAEHDGEVMADYCRTFSVSPRWLLREMLARCSFPSTWTLH